MKKLLALLLLSPLAFTETTDLHCVSLEDLPEGKLRNKLISLDVINEVVWMMDVNIEPSYNYNTNLNRVKLREMNKKIKVSDNVYEWKGFVQKTPDKWKTEYTDEWSIGRKSLELVVWEFWNPNIDYRPWLNLDSFQCEIINNKNEKLNYYRNEEMKWKIYRQKMREESLRKNKI